jgi:predicted permease
MRDFVAYVRSHLPRREDANDRYDEVVDELASELEARYTALVQRGSSDEDAWAAVQAQVPSWPTLADELAGASGHSGIFSIERWRREVGFGLRVLRKDRGFTATAMITLAICLGGHAAMVAAIDGMLFHALRVPEPERVLLMANRYPRPEPGHPRLSATPDYGDRLQYVTAFEEQAMYNFTAATIETGGVPTRMAGMIATPSMFRLLRVTPALGRLFTEAEGTPGNDTRVLLTDGLWRELFAADPTVIGRAVRLSGREFTIVGVLPREFSFGDPGARFWIPLALTDQQRSDEARHRNGWFSIGRLKPGATIDQVRAQLKTLDAANLARMPARLQAILTSTGFYTDVEPLQDVLVRPVRGPLYLLWGAAVAVLVIGVGNLLTIALARARARLHELGTRLALGASRFDIVRQLLVEGLLIALGGAIGALALAAWMLSAVRLAQPGLTQLHLDPVTAGITAALAALAGVLMALVSASPLVTTPLGTMLQGQARGGTGGRTVRTTWRLLVIAQMACSFLLLLGCALLWISLRNLLAIDPGFRTDNVVTGVINLSSPRYAADDATRMFVDRALNSIRQLPGVTAAGTTTIVPMTSAGQTGVVVAEGYVARPGELPVSGLRSVVTPGYFEAVDTPLVRGRYFDTRDEDPASRSIVIDERLAHRFWPDGDPIGRRLFCPMNASQLTKIDANAKWLTVVGVVRPARLHGPMVEDTASGTSGTYYVPFAASVPRETGFVIRADREWTGLVREVRTTLAQLDPQIALFDVRTLSERTELAVASRTNTMHLAMLFAGVGVFLSALGLYGMLAYVVSQRTREIGIRLAVGSAPRAIIALILREGLWLALAGVAAGTVTATIFGRLLASYLYGITPSNPWLLLAMTAALALVAVCACLLPARRAARVDVIRILNGP